MGYELDGADFSDKWCSRTHDMHGAFFVWPIYIMSSIKWFTMMWPVYLSSALYYRFGHGST